MKIMFLRESEGVYQFGQKRVNIKITKGDNILIRVGGGFMGIEQFIKTYTNGEVDSIRKRDPLQRFSQKMTV